MTFLNWYTDGPSALAGLVLTGLVLLTAFVIGARSCAPLVKLMPWVLAWHLVVFAFNIFWLLPFYSDGSDALNYHSEGIEIAKLIREGAFGNIEWGLSTKAMEIIAGFLYAPFGADAYGATFFSAVLGLGGCLYFCRAFSLWAPPEQVRKYSMLVLLMPSLAMWTSTFGKDSWIAFGLGLSAYGYSRMQYSASWKGTPHFALGFAITGLVRPHVALAMAMSMAAAYMWGITQRAGGSTVNKVLRVVLLVGMVAGLYPLTRDFVGLSEASSLGAVDEFARNNSEANAQLGGSVVEVDVTPGVGGALRAFPRGVVRVLLEPFPWEVSNVNAALAAAENVFVAVLLIVYARRMASLFRQAIRIPYFLFSGFLMVALLMMFSLLPNLGLISRQRVQLLPSMFALIVGAEAAKRRQRVPPGTIVRIETINTAGMAASAR